MAAALENIPDKPRFDVYSMIVILTFVFTLGSTLMLNDHLDKVWDFWAKPEQRKEHAVHLTVMNSDDPNSQKVKLNETDLKEWDLASEQDTGSKSPFPYSNYEWPKGFDPNTNSALKPDIVFEKDQPVAPYDLLLKDYKPSLITELAPRPDAPTTEASKESAPKADAPKADAPKDAAPPANP
jgi:hypothetical protein